MKYFCSKDCPDTCVFETDANGKFRALPNSFDTIPFYCSKLPHYYKREMKPLESFLTAEGKRKSVSHPEVCKIFGNYLKDNKGKKILFLRGSGSLGYRMGYWNQFFSNFKNCYFVDDNPCDETGVVAHIQDFGYCTNPPVENLENVDNIFNFGRNAKVTNPHLYAYLKRMKKEMIYFDPIFSETAGLADKYVRVEPSTDGIIAALICKKLSLCKVDCDKGDMLKAAKVDESVINLLAGRIKRGKTAFITGFGLQRYQNGMNTVQWINRLAYYTGNIDNLYYSRPSKSGLSGISYQAGNRLTICEAYNRMKDDFFDLVVVIACNPCVTYPEADFLSNYFKKTKLAVIDTSYTATSEFADFFIKVGGMFSQEDVMGSYFFDIPLRKRGRFENSLLSDTDVIKALAEVTGIDMNVKKADELEYKKADLKRVPNLTDITVKMPLTSDRLRFLTVSHSLYLNSQLADERYNSVPEIFISRDDAECHGVADGEHVEVSNENGICFGKIKISDKVANGYVMMYKSKNYRGHTQNMLTPCVSTDAGLGVSYYDTFGDIRRMDEKI